MNFLYGFAGIPEAVYDGICEKEKFIVREDGEFFGAPLKERSYGYDVDYLKQFESEFVKRIESDTNNRLANTAFALIYISYGEKHDTLVKETFHPSILTASVLWKFEYGTNMQIAQQKNTLATQLELATRNVKKALSALQDETTRHNSTPLLLPLESFASNALKPAIEDLSQEILNNPNKAETIAQFVSDFKKTHPQKEFPKNGHFKKVVNCFVDDKGVFFKPPGNDKHALLRKTGEQHQNACLLTARRRLGAAYEMRFHYDCQIPGEPKFTMALPGCHGSKASITGEPHINIAPNDYARP